MKIERLVSKALSPAIFAAAILFGSSVFAQVKIGANPTTIEVNSNLEVEASTAGRKVKVDITTAPVTIADGTQCTTKVLTSDANGGASRQQAGAQNSPVLLSAKQTVPQFAYAYVNNPVNFDLKDFDKGSNFNLGNDRFEIPSDGYMRNQSYLWGCRIRC